MSFSWKLLLFNLSNHFFANHNIWETSGISVLHRLIVFILIGSRSHLAKWNVLESQKGSTKSKRSKKVDSPVDVSGSSGADDIWKCHACGFVFGSTDDPKLTDDWLTCVGCGHKYHESCAEDDGVVDDDLQLTCRLCLDWSKLLTWPSLYRNLARCDLICAYA